MQEVFEPGTIVFWVGRVWHGFAPIVMVGQIEQQFAGECIVNYLVPRENRVVYSADYPDGIPWNDFQNTFKYHKLPKGWDCDTRLFRVDDDNSVHKALSDYPFTAEGVRKAVNDGLMVIPITKRFDNVESVITKDGYMVKMAGPGYDADRRTCETIKTYKLHRDYDSANAEKESILAEYQRQASLTDEEWAIEQVDKELAKWRSTTVPTDAEYKDVRSRLLALPDVASIEVRFGLAGVEWKYEHNKRWTAIRPEIG